MAGTFPRFRLYQSDGITPVYEFDYVLEINDFEDPADFVEHRSLRGQGSIIVEGSDYAPWDLNITFVLKGNNYENLVSQINSLITTITKFEKYILKIDLTPSSTKDYKVQRLTSISFPLNNQKKRVDFQTCQIVLRVNSWN